MIGWALETFVATTLLMALVLAIRAPVRKAFGPGVAYVLWLLPVFRLVMPPLPGQWTLTSLIAPLAREAQDAPGMVVGVMNPATLAPELAHAPVVHLEVAGHHAAMALVPPTTVADGPNILLLLIGVWGIGALLFLSYHLIAHRRYCRRLLGAARIDRTVAQGRVRVIETAATHGPLAFGIFRKYVAFPRDFAERYDEQERDLALAHELGHHVRGDLIANWVALIVLALHWFNPVAWRAFRAFRADQEMACDALVLAGRAQALRHAYGRAIVKSAHGGAVSAACHLHTVNEVKGRLRMLSNTRKSSPIRIAAGLIGVGSVSLAALGLTASGTQAAEGLKTKVEAVTGVSLAQDLPAPPAPPAAPDAPLPPAPPAAPEAPEAPEAPHRVVTRVIRTGDGKDAKQIKKVVIVRANGESEDIDMPDIEAITANIPETRSANCGKGKKADGDVVEHRTEGRKQIMIICTDRIAVMTADAQKMAMAHMHMGLDSALMGMRQARRSVEAERNISEAERAEALAGIDRAMAEIQKQKSKQD